VSESIQAVTLVLADGRRLQFTGRYQLAPGDLGSAKVVEVLVSEAIPLQEGCRIEAMAELRGEANGG
jgi:hypothetical protein